MMELVLHLMDIVENSARAGAEVVALTIAIDTVADRLTLDILDNGKGMDEVAVGRALDPFGTTKPGKRTGLGLPLLKDAAERTGGGLEVQSTPDEGTAVSVQFGLSHVDRQPLGDLVETLAVMLVSHPQLDFVLQIERDGEAFVWQSPEIYDVLGPEARRSDPAVLNWVRQALAPARQLLENV